MKRCAPPAGIFPGPLDPARCAYWVTGATGAMQQCRRRAAEQRQGYGLCWQHAPRLTAQPSRKEKR